MNTRIQVEHPVTEAITGLDLVEWQLRVAAGETLPKQQSELSLSGHSVEVRLYAEDPASGFLPSPGKVHGLSWPQVSDDTLRIDTGIAAGGEVSRFYDPMIAKLIARSDTREEAIDRLVSALKDIVVLGVKTNAGFLVDLISHPGFRQGGVDTGFIDAHIKALQPSRCTQRNQALAIAAWLATKSTRSNADQSNDQYSPFSLTSAWQLGSTRDTGFDVIIDGARISANTRWPASGSCEISISGACFSISALECQNPLSASASIDGHAVNFAIAHDDDRLLVYVEGQHLNISAYDILVQEDEEAAGIGTICAPMTGKLQRLFIARGDKVAKGDKLAVVEAMKMEHPLVAGISGIVTELRAGEGTQVNDGDIVIVVEAEIAGN